MVVLFFGAEALFILSVVLLLVLFCPLFEERRFGLFVNNFLILANLWITQSHTLSNIFSSLFYDNKLFENHKVEYPFSQWNMTFSFSFFTPYMPFFALRFFACITCYYPFLLFLTYYESVLWFIKSLFYFKKIESVVVSIYNQKLVQKLIRY